MLLTIFPSFIKPVVSIFGPESASNIGWAILTFIGIYFISLTESMSNLNERYEHPEQSYYSLQQSEFRRMMYTLVYSTIMGTLSGLYTLLYMIFPADTSYPLLQIAIVFLTSSIILYVFYFMDNANITKIYKQKSRNSSIRDAVSNLQLYDNLLNNKLFSDIQTSEIIKRLSADVNNQLKDALLKNPISSHNELDKLNNSDKNDSHYRASLFNWGPHLISNLTCLIIFIWFFIHYEVIPEILALDQSMQFFIASILFWFFVGLNLYLTLLSIRKYLKNKNIHSKNDQTEKTITIHIMNGTWENGTTAPKTIVIPLIQASESTLRKGHFEESLLYARDSKGNLLTHGNLQPLLNFDQDKKRYSISTADNDTFYYYPYHLPIKFIPTFYSHILSKHKINKSRPEAFRRRNKHKPLKKKK